MKTINSAPFALAFVLFVFAIGAGAEDRQAPQDKATSNEHVTVYREPTCDCCIKWARYLRDRGFHVTIRNATNMYAVRTANRVPAGLASCHTALVEGYVVEGHVPVESVSRLLETRPDDVIGIAVPGMPIGSPGMEGPNPQRYAVIAFHRDGRTSVFARY